MPVHRGQPQMITFKADEALVEAMAEVPNRSEFIREAILAALDGVCPLCHGTGVLKRAVREMLRSHPLVTGYEPGKPQEGGEGVTVARLVSSK